MLQKRLEGNWENAQEVIVLAGGLGTRLREAVPDLPKCMAPVAGKPFLYYVINHLRKNGIQRFVFSLGYKHEYIESWLEKNLLPCNTNVVSKKNRWAPGGRSGWHLKKQPVQPFLW